MLSYGGDVCSVSATSRDLYLSLYGTLYVRARARVHAGVSGGGGGTRSELPREAQPSRREPLSRGLMAAPPLRLMAAPLTWHRPETMAMKRDRRKATAGTPMQRGAWGCSPETSGLPHLGPRPGEPTIAERALKGGSDLDASDSSPPRPTP